jgi:ribonuclease P protein component
LSSLVLLRYQPTNRRPGYRAAVIVSRKIHKSAVVRNRIRRRIYAVLTSLENRLSEPYDLVFIVLNEAIATLPAKELSNLIRSQLEQAGALSKPAGTVHSHVIVEKVHKEN